MKNNAFLSAVDRRANQIIQETRHIHSQMCLDAAIIACNDVFNMGPTRCMEFVEAFNSALKTIATMTVEDGKNDKELWFTKRKLDERLEKICGEHFEPWEKRYN